MSNPSKNKGSRIEREIVDLHRAIGVSASRVPLSGAAGGEFSGDIRIGDGMVGEVKARSKGQGFATIERWLGKNNFLFLRRDRASPLVVMTWESYAKLISKST